MFLSPTDENEVIIVVNSCNSKTPVDSEGLNMKLVKSIIGSIVKPVTHICNSSLLSGIFPDRMPKSYRYLDQGAKPKLLITDIFRCFHNFQKY